MADNKWNGETIEYGDTVCWGNCPSDEEVAADLFMGAIILVVIGSVIILTIGWFMGLVGRILLKGFRG